MKNKRGQFQTGIAIVIIVLVLWGVVAGIGWFSKDSVIESKNAKISDLREEVNAVKLNLTRANRLIDENERYILHIFENLEDCHNSTGRFNLFWKENVFLTQFWTDILNVSVIITIGLSITLFGLTIKIFLRRKK